MGNSQSASSSSKPHKISRKRSAGISKLCCCASDEQFTGSVASEETYCNEKQLPEIGFASYLPEALKDTTAAYKAFLKAFPEYQLTWTLDTLRQSDFARLDHSGETYVDYMGGTIYPESLVRKHTAFLNHNVLGNTHSVSNR